MIESKTGLGLRDKFKENTVNLLNVIEQLVDEKGLDRSLLQSIICEGMLAAYEKRFPDIDFVIDYDSETDGLSIRSKKTVVSSVEDGDVEISLRKARSIKPGAELGDEVEVPFEEKIGRIEILKAKQVVASRIKEVEAAQVYEQFKDKEGLIVQGTVHKVERVGVLVKLQDYMAFLPKSLSIPGEKYLVGQPIRAVLKEILPEPKNENQLILDQASSEFLRQLLSLEIPEVYDRLVEIKSIVRSPGYKSKVVVYSNDPNIDPVGTCVGVGGARIKPVLKEIGGEKIDIIKWSENQEEFIRDALKPAQVDRVEMTGDNKAMVWLDEDQRSLAIGKLGQNINLASELTGVEIQLADKAGGAGAPVFED